MKKYSIKLSDDIGIGINDISILKRNTVNSIKGITITVNGFVEDFFIASGWSGSLPSDYNDPLLYTKGRRVDILPESDENNTIITNDGLIGVIYEISGETYLTVLDLFESESGTYGNITPIDYDLLKQYSEITNPLAKKVFICYKNDNSKLTTLNREIYRTTSEYVYFESELDYALPRPISDTENGFYRTTPLDWTDTYKETSDFQFIKKQFFYFIGPADLEVTLKGSSLPIEIEKIADSLHIYRLKYLDIGIDPQTIFVTFELTTNESYCSIIVY